jgi:hypothetical protein
MCERVGAVNREVVSWSKDAHLCVWELPDVTGNSGLGASIATAASSAPSGTGSLSSSSSAPNLSALPSSPAPRHGARDMPGTPGKAAQSLRDELEDVEQAPIEGLNSFFFFFFFFFFVKLILCLFGSWWFSFFEMKCFAIDLFYYYFCL